MWKKLNLAGIFILYENFFQVLKISIKCFVTILSHVIDICLLLRKNITIILWVISLSNLKSFGTFIRGMSNMHNYDITAY